MSKHTTLAQLEAAQRRTKSAFDGLETRVQTLEGVGAQANVLEGIKVNGAAQAIADKIVDILIQTGTANGTIKVAGTDVSVAGLAALAYKAEISEDELSTALKNAIDAKAEASDLSTLSGKVSTMIGSVTGDDTKSIRAIAAEEVASIVDNADTRYDTLKEIAEWIMSDTTGAAKMANDISNLTTKLTLGTHEVEGEQVEYATVKAYVEAVVASLGMSNYYTKSETDDLLDDKVDKVTGKDLSTNDFTDAYKQKLDNIETATDDEVTTMLNSVWGTPASTPSGD